MIRSGVERTQRAASRRIVLRALVVGGFAGAAWLLSASAAQAADAQSAPDHAAYPAGASVLTPLTNVLGTATAPVLDATSALVGGATAPADPATAVVPPGATAARSTTIVGPAPATSPDRAADRAADPVGATTALLGLGAEPGRSSAAGQAKRDDAGPPAAAPTGPLHTLVAPLGLTNVTYGLLAPVTRVVDPVLAPLTGVLRPVGVVLQAVVSPIDATLGTVTRTVSRVLPAPRHGVGAGPLSGPVSAVTPGASGVDADPTRTGGAPRASHTEDGSAVKKSTRHVAGTLERGTAAPSAPGRPQPAPMRMYLGAGTGIPSSGSGSPTEGGAFGTVSSSVAGSMVAFHRLPAATDVAVLRLDAEDTTVSPD
jgi:hypothetical protein